jgi:YHS domain-containing protein
VPGDHPSGKKEVRPVATDPVCGMEVDERQASGRSEYDGKVYYFCSAECQEEFEDDPESYLDELDETDDEAEQQSA